MHRLLIILFVSFTTYAQAQQYKPFKVNISVGYAQPVGRGLASGFLVGIEPKYAVSSHLALGLRLESAVLERDVTWDTDKQANSGDKSTRNSALLTATYLFNPVGASTIRPFIGAGVGLFGLSSAGTIRIDQSQTNKMQLFVADYSGIGGVFRGGIKVGHLMASLEYNPVPTHVYSLGGTNFDSKGSYTGIRLGIDIGGGPNRM